MKSYIVALEDFEGDADETYYDTYEEAKEKFETYVNDETYISKYYGVELKVYDWYNREGYSLEFQEFE